MIMQMKEFWHSLWTTLPIALTLVCVNAAQGQLTCEVDGQYSTSGHIQVEDCIFKRSTHSPDLATVTFQSTSQATIHVTCSKNGITLYEFQDDYLSGSDIKIKTMVDLHGANCSVTGCFARVFSGDRYRLPKASCVVAYDECLPEYCPYDATCNVTTDPIGSYTCTCNNQTNYEFNYTSKMCEMAGEALVGKNENGTTNQQLKAIDFPLHLQSHNNIILPDDTEECNSSCHSFALCTNKLGNFTCTCLEGYTGNGTFCSRSIESTLTMIILAIAVTVVIISSCVGASAIMLIQRRRTKRKLQKELCFGSKKAWNGPLTDVTDQSQYDVKITRHSDFTLDKQSLDILQFFLRGSTVSKVDISNDDCSSLADEQGVGTEDVARSCTEEHEESVEGRKVLNVESDAKNAGMVNCNDEPYTDYLDPPLIMKEQPCDTTYMQSKALSCAPQGVDGMSSDPAVALFNLDDCLDNPYGDSYSSQLNCESDTEGGAEIVDVPQSVIALDEQDVKHQDVDKTITSGSQDETGIESDSIHNGALNLDQASEHFSDTYVFDETKQQAASGYIETSTGGHNRASSGMDDDSVFDFCCEEI